MRRKTQPGALSIERLLVRQLYSYKSSGGGRKHRARRFKSLVTFPGTVLQLPCLRTATRSVITGTPCVTFTRNSASKGLTPPDFETPRRCRSSDRESSRQ